MTHPPTSAPKARVEPRRADDRVLITLIGLFKLVKGALLVALGVGLLHFGDSFSDVVAGLARDVRIDPDGRHLGRTVQAMAAMSGRRLEAVTGGLFVYAALFFTEGIGLLLGKPWAEYFTVIVTGSFIPLEMSELVRRPGGLRLALILGNIAIVWYLASRIRRRSVRTSKG